VNWKEVKLSGGKGEVEGTRNGRVDFKRSSHWPIFTIVGRPNIYSYFDNNYYHNRLFGRPTIW